MILITCSNNGIYCVWSCTYYTGLAQCKLLQSVREDVWEMYSTDLEVCTFYVSVYTCRLSENNFAL